MPRWPFNNTFKSWGIEAYYSNVNATKPSQICYAGSEGCGIARVPRDELTLNDTCASPLAPDHDFCSFESFSYQCYGGVGFQFLPLYPKPTSSLPHQPADSAAASWSPSQQDGEQKDALKQEPSSDQPRSESILDFYSLHTLEAFAALAKLAYCGESWGLPNAVASTCKGSKGVCSRAGFGIVPNSVKSVGVPYQSDLTEPYYMKDTIYFFTANIRRTTASFAEAPYFMPAEACVLAFRGSANEQNMKMNDDLSLVPLNDTACEGCHVHQGYVTAWKTALQSRVLSALKASGCEPTTHKETVNKVFVVGHSMGGNMATLSLYFLHKLGFDVQLSWNLEGGRPGDPAFMDYINTKLFATSRPGAYWQLEHANDFVPRTPPSVDTSGGNYGRSLYNVHFNTSNTSKPTFCTSKDDIDKASECGIYQFPRAHLQRDLPSMAHCGVPYAPKSWICMSPMASQCLIGGALAGTA
jgi:hypothetical protein